MNKIVLTSMLTCPGCGHVKTETMPTALASGSTIVNIAVRC